MSKIVPSLFTNSVPLVVCFVSTSLTFLYTSVSPETNPISGVPNIFVTFTNLQTFNIQRSGSQYFYPDSTNVDGELPFFAQGSLRTFNANDNDFRSFGSPGSRTLLLV